MNSGTKCKQMENGVDHHNHREKHFNSLNTNKIGKKCYNPHGCILVHLNIPIIPWLLNTVQAFQLKILNIMANIVELP